MKSTSYAYALASAATLAHGAALFPRAGTCSPISNVQTTFYGFPDNSPPGAGTSYDCGKGSKAGGTGTFADPLTFATAPGEFNKCEVIYAPYVKKYLIFQDECAECTSNWNGGKKYHVDIWTGSPTSNGGDLQIKCENALTPDAQMVLRNPPSSLEVDSGELFASGACNKQHVYNGGQASCAGGSSNDTPSSPSPSTPSSSASSSTSTAATPSTATTSDSAPTSSPAGHAKANGAGAFAPAQPTGSGDAACEWAGHCAGATCRTENDCSGSMTCKSGKCAA